MYVRGSSLLVAFAFALSLAGCTSDTTEQPVGGSPSPVTEPGRVVRPEFAVVKLDPSVTSMPDRVFTGETRSVSTRLDDCQGSATRTQVFIRWKQGAKTLRKASQWLHSMRDTNVAVAIVRFDSEALLLTLDEHDQVITRTQMDFQDGRWWPDRRILCSDG